MNGLLPVEQVMTQLPVEQVMIQKIWPTCYVNKKSEK